MGLSPRSKSAGRGRRNRAGLRRAAISPAGILEDYQRAAGGRRDAGLPRGWAEATLQRVRSSQDAVAESEDLRFSLKWL